MKTASFSTYLKDPNLLGEHFKGDSYFPMKTLAKVFDIARGHPYKLTKREQAFYEKVTGRVTIPKNLREWWMQLGRGAGKSKYASAKTLYLATYRDWKKVFSAGERGVSMLLCPDRRQARIARNYIQGFLDASPQLKSVVENTTKEMIQFSTGANAEIHTASLKSVRGYPPINVHMDECAFIPSDEWAAHPDIEIAAALMPGLARVPGSLLMGSSTPYAKRGLLYQKNIKFYGTEDDAVLFIQGRTRWFNETIPQSTIDDALKEDEPRARSEWLAEFRDDVSSIFPIEGIQAVVNHSRPLEWPVDRFKYVGFLDAAGGSGTDSMSAAVAHRENEKVILDWVIEAVPPFSPAEVSRQFAEKFRQYAITTVQADKYAGSWPSETFQKHGVHVKPVTMSKSEIYLEALPLINSGLIELPDHKKLLFQLQSLERRVRSGGRDSIDHPQNIHSHDDLANSACGALVSASRSQNRSVTWGRKPSRLALQDVRAAVYQHKVIR